MLDMVEIEVKRNYMTFLWPWTYELFLNKLSKLKKFTKIIKKEPLLGWELAYKNILSTLKIR